MSHFDGLLLRKTNGWLLRVYGGEKRRDVESRHCVWGCMLLMVFFLGKNGSIILLTQRHSVNRTERSQARDLMETNDGRVCLGRFWGAWRLESLDWPQGRIGQGRSGHNE